MRVCMAYSHQRQLWPNAQLSTHRQPTYKASHTTARSSMDASDTLARADSETQMEQLSDSGESTQISNSRERLERVKEGVMGQAVSDAERTYAEDCSRRCTEGYSARKRPAPQHKTTNHSPSPPYRTSTQSQKALSIPIHPSNRSRLNHLF